MPELLTVASCRKDWKRISAESSVVSPTIQSVKRLELIWMSIAGLPPRHHFWRMAKCGDRHEYLTKNNNNNKRSFLGNDIVQDKCVGYLDSLEVLFQVLPEISRNWTWGKATVFWMAWTVFLLAWTILWLTWTVFWLTGTVFWMAWTVFWLALTEFWLACTQSGTDSEARNVLGYP